MNHTLVKRNDLNPHQLVDIDMTGLDIDEQRDLMARVSDVLSQIKPVMKNEIQVIVAGGMGTGKSTVVQMLRDYLSNSFTSVTAEYLHGDTPRPPTHLSAAWQSISRKTKIRIREVQLSREGQFPKL